MCDGNIPPHCQATTMTKDIMKLRDQLNNDFTALQIQSCLLLAPVSPMDHGSWLICAASFMADLALYWSGSPSNNCRTQS